MCKSATESLKKRGAAELAEFKGKDMMKQIIDFFCYIYTNALLWHDTSTFRFSEKGN